MRITAIDIQEKQFHLSLRGYNPEEVDIFLDGVAGELELLNKENNNLKRKLDEVAFKEKPEEELNEEANEMRKVMENTLISAQKTAEELIKNAKIEAINIRKKAEKKAKEIAFKSQDESKEMLENIQEIQRMHDELNKKLSESYIKLSSVFKLREVEKKPPISEKILDTEVDKKKAKIGKKKEALKSGQKLEKKDESTPITEGTNVSTSQFKGEVEKKKMDKRRKGKKEEEKSEGENTTSLADSEIAEKFFEE